VFQNRTVEVKAKAMKYCPGVVLDVKECPQVPIPAVGGLPPATVAIQFLKLRRKVFDTLQELVDSFLETFCSVSAGETNARVNLRKTV